MNYSLPCRAKPAAGEGRGGGSVREMTADASPSSSLPFFPCHLRKLFFAHSPALRCAKAHPIVIRYKGILDELHPPARRPHHPRRPAHPGRPLRPFGRCALHLPARIRRRRRTLGALLDDWPARARNHPHPRPPPANPPRWRHHRRTRSGRPARLDCRLPRGAASGAAFA